MPLYEFECMECGHRTTLSRAIDQRDDELWCAVEDCPGMFERAISRPSVQFKGTGFYSTDKGKR